MFFVSNFHPVAFRKSKRLSKGNSNNNWVYLHFNVFSSLSLIVDTFHTFLARIGIWKCWFLRRGKNQSTRRKTSRSRVENQQQTPTWRWVWESGNRTREHRWEASTVTTAPSLLPKICKHNIINVYMLLFNFTFGTVWYFPLWWVMIMYCNYVHMHAYETKEKLMPNCICCS